MINFLPPDNVDDALLNWAAWHSPTYDADDPLNAVSLVHAVAVDSLYDMLHYREKQAINVKYLNKKEKWTEAALYTAEQAIEQGLRDRKLLTNRVK